MGNYVHPVSDRLMNSICHGADIINTKIMTQIRLKDKIRGSLVGGAIGDALGYPVEFVNSFELIRAKYGVNGIVGYDLSNLWTDEQFGKAVFSDDTQMTLYTAEGILEAEKTASPLIPAICRAYIAWLGPQIGKKVKLAYKSELAHINELNRQRAPGTTCISSLIQINAGKKPVNSSKGCGGVMRVAPIGLYGASHCWPLEKTARIAGDVAELTHLHPLSTYSSAGLAVLCQLCVSTEQVDEKKFKEYLDVMLGIITKVYGGDAQDLAFFEDLIRKAVRDEDNELSDWQVIENELGGGWVAEETFAIAIFSVLRHFDNFKDCIVCAINHGGDSDSTGAVAGNIIGAIHGYDKIPTCLKDGIQLHDLLTDMADRLAEHSNNTI